jgi:lipopolysaccharide transport system permease protein
MKLNKYEVLLQPNRSWFDLELHDLLNYRYLLFLNVRRDFVAKYKQTILGPIWLVLQPLVGSVVFTIIFGMVVEIPTDGLPIFLFYLCGQLGWSYFSHTYGSSACSLQHNAEIFRKVYFPRFIPPLSVCFSNLITSGIQLLVFFIFFAYFKMQEGYEFNCTIWLVCLPLIIFQGALLAMGLGFLMSALTVKYRDFSHLSGFLMQLMLYCTPIIFPLSLLIEKLPNNLQWLIHLNPLAFNIEMYRLMFLGKGTIPATLPISSILITLLLFLLGLIVFNKVQRNYIDYV